MFFHSYKLPLYWFGQFHLSCLLVKHSLPGCNSFGFFIPSGYLIFWLLVLKHLRLVFTDVIIRDIQFFQFNLLLDIVKGVFMRVIVKIELHRNFLLKLFLLFVSMLVNVNKLYWNLNLDTFLAVERNVDVVSVFESGLFVICVDNNLMRRNIFLVTLQSRRRYFSLWDKHLQILIGTLSGIWIPDWYFAWAWFTFTWNSVSQFVIGNELELCVDIFPQNCVGVVFWY